MAFQPFTPTRWVSTTVTAWLLAGCSSTPLPAWQPPATTAAATAPTVPPVVHSATPNMPYSAAVAARFPDPGITYSTPGLQAGRTRFTSNDEITTWMRGLQAQPTPGVQASLLPIGRSQQGVPLDALLLTRSATPDAATVLASGRPTVLLIGQQHGDEPAGSEALLVVARELAQGLLEPLLDKINVLVLPRANPDGATANQRTTANGIDMNRDHLLLNTPEARALAQLVRDYQPMVVLDAHEYTVVGRYLQKFGSVQKYDALLQYAMTANLPEFLPRASEEWYRRPVVAALQSQGLNSEWYYTTSTNPDDHQISMGGVQPDTGRNVNGLKNAVSMLLESRGVGIGRLHIQRRVHTQVTAMASVLQSTASRAEQLGKLRSYMERDVSSQACRNQAIIEAAPTSAQYELTMLDPATGADRILSVDWNSALELQTRKSRPRPCGYWLSSNAVVAVDRLQMLGVQVMRFMEPGSLLADAYHATASNTGSRKDVRGTVDNGGAPVLHTEVSLVRGMRDAPQGSYYVPLGQPLGNLVLAALEPDTQNSYFANRLLDTLEDSLRVMSKPTGRLEKVP